MPKALVRGLHVAADVDARAAGCRANHVHRQLADVHQRVLRVDEVLASAGRCTSRGTKLSVTAAMAS